MRFIFFSKYHGNGNDFILIDDRKNTFPLEDKGVIQKMCHRNLGIGADGLILLQLSEIADVKMRILNKDGSEAEICGNGLCCLMRFLKDLGLDKKKYTVETLKDRVEAFFVKKDKIALLMEMPKILKEDVSIEIGNKPYRVMHINSGVPHIVSFVEDLTLIDVKATGKILRNHPLFQPLGVNVNFAMLQRNKNICIRTYERGVEDESFACGTGALAVAIAAKRKFDLAFPMTMQFKYGRIEVNIDKDRNKIKLTNEVNFVYSGSLCFK